MKVIPGNRENIISIHNNNLFLMLNFPRLSFEEVYVVEKKLKKPRP
jgi:hypothetical protein